MNMRLIKKMMKYMKHFINGVFYHQYWVNYKNGESHRWSCIESVLTVSSSKFPYFFLIFFIFDINGITLTKVGVYSVIIATMLISFTLYSIYFYRGKRYLKIIYNNQLYRLKVCRWYSWIMLLKTLLLVAIFALLPTYIKEHL